MSRTVLLSERYRRASEKWPVVASLIPHLSIQGYSHCPENMAELKSSGPGLRHTCAGIPALHKLAQASYPPQNGNSASQVCRKNEIRSAVSRV